MDTKERIIRLDMLIKFQEHIIKILDKMSQDIRNGIDYPEPKETIGDKANNDFDMVKSTNDMLNNIAGGDNGK
jgi:hypothetical protein